METEKAMVGTPCPPCESVPCREETPARTEKKGPGFTAVDAAFALVFLVVGWLFWELQIWKVVQWFGGWGAMGQGTAVFCGVYVAAVLAYLYFSGRRPPRESWFWLGALVLLGGAYALPYGGGLLGVFQYMALLLTASYWTLCAGGRLLKNQETSNWLPLDLLNAAFVLPWGNFCRLPAALWDAGKRWKGRRAPREAAAPRRKALLGALGGVLAAALCLCFVLPPLMAADAGFAALLSGWTDGLAAWFENWDARLLEYGLKLCFALPTALYLYGMVYGCARGRRTCVWNKKEVCAVQKALRCAPRSTVLTALFILCAVYLLFVSLQAKYLFGAFWGQLPAGFSHAEYARQGFFELCRVAAINLVLLLAANIVSRARADENRLLRVCNVALAVLTLLLLATAASKMGLYIAAYGLTVRRVVASVFMVWMALVFALVLVRQFRGVSLVRAAVFTGAVLFCLLCALPVQDGIRAYNKDRVSAGTLDPDALAWDFGTSLWLD